MNTSFFDAVIEIVLPKKAHVHDVTFVLKKEKVPGSFSFYETEIPDLKKLFIAVSLSKPMTVKWGHSFDVLSPGSEKVLGSGKILYPADQKPIGKEAKKRTALLPQLPGKGNYGIEGKRGIEVCSYHKENTASSLPEAGS